jgi:hypothetical protein
MTTNTPNQVRREMPNAINPFLRFQVGIAEKRPMNIPIYVGRKQEGSYIIPEQVWIFALKGFGATMEAAEKMAGTYTPTPKAIQNYEDKKMD